MPAAKDVPSNEKKLGPTVFPLRPSLAIHDLVESVTLTLCCRSNANRMASAVAKSRRALASWRACSCAIRSALLIVAPGGASPVAALGALASGSKK